MATMTEPCLPFSSAYQLPYNTDPPPSKRTKCTQKTSSKKKRDAGVANEDLLPCLKLKKPSGAMFKKATLEETIYEDDPDVVNGWGKFYLPNPVKMQVFGVVEGTSCPCEELVLMTCEDLKVYAYDGEELHLVASSKKQIYEEGIEYPASKSYYKGEAFKQITKEGWAELRKRPVGKKLDEEHNRLVDAIASDFLENLNFKKYCEHNHS